MSHVLGYLLLGVFLIVIIGFSVFACWLPAWLVLVLLKVPRERHALGMAVLIAPMAFALLSSLAGSMNTGYGLGVTAAMGAAAGVGTFALLHRMEPHDGRPGLALFAPIANWWREIAAEAERDAEREARAKAARKAADAAPTIDVGQYATKRWWVRVSGGRFNGERVFANKADALSFVERVEKKGGRRVGAGADLSAQ